MPPTSKFPVLLTAVFLLGLVSPVMSGLDTNHVFLVRAQKTLVNALQQQAAETNSIEAALLVGKAAFEVGELATNNTQRAEAARLGIAACHKALARQTNSAPAHYYLGVNLGELAQAEAPSLTAYRLVYEVENEFKAAAALDVKFDHAGPARTLGLLYFQAPSWPLSVGSKAKAREWLERAATLAPDFPENQLNLLEAHLKWHQQAEALAVLKKIQTQRPAAQTNFVGETWERAWLEWNSRLKTLQGDYHRIFGSGN